MLAALVAHRRTPTNVELTRRRPGLRILPPREALETLRGGDTVIGRLDVSQHLDGIEPGLWELARLEASGVTVLNRPRALIAAHDKLATSRALADAGVPHPRTIQVTAPTAHIPLATPVVVKPRFGSWGRDVVRCDDQAALRRTLAELSHRRWFKSHGALVQELVPPQGEDLRLLVAGGAVVGAIRRLAAPGEWRTNVALGARRLPVIPPTDACALAVAAAGAIDADLVGVDLLPTLDGGWIVIELNGAVEFTTEYAPGATDVFANALDALDARLVSAVA